MFVAVLLVGWLEFVIVIVAIVVAILSANKDFAMVHACFLCFVVFVFCVFLCFVFFCVLCFFVFCVFCVLCFCVFVLVTYILVTHSKT